MKEHFQYILNEYPTAYNQTFANHPLGELVRRTIPQAISKIITEKDRYVVKGSIGQGNWAINPWIAILDILITNTPQSGYYPVFLFKGDMSGFYLSLNQGITDIKIKYKKDAQQVLSIKAADYRAQINVIPNNFKESKIQLNEPNSAKSQNATLYEAGNIVAKYYPEYNLPSEEQLQHDLLELLKAYEQISYNEVLPSTQAEKENDEEKYKGYEDLRKFRFHKRIERNVQLSKKVKEIQGYTCKACELNFKEKYGPLGEFFIEAHHLRPISKLTAEKIRLDARTDFTVLCSNCHSMIHRLDDPSDLEQLKRLIIR